MMDEFVIETKKLTKKYGHETAIQVSFSFEMRYIS